MPLLPADIFKGLVTGIQSVAKGRQGAEAANDVQVSCVIHVANICLP